MDKIADSIVIVDYGMGNIGSICNMLKYLGTKSIVTSDREKIKDAKKIILPGVGHFERAMFNLKSLNLIDILRIKVLEDKVPILGICLGMQLMCEHSEEGSEHGLSFIKANVEKFIFNSELKLKVPHMGWNEIKIQKDSTILSGLDSNSRFYFVHSYYVKCHNLSNVLSFTTYGLEFVSSFQCDNIVGVQFHPEKSHKYGIQLLKNFIEKFK